MRLWMIACSLTYLLTACGGSMRPEQQRRDVEELAQTFPVLEQLRVEAYRNQDWCKNIAYRRGKFSNMLDRQTCNLFRGKPQAFDVQAQQDFAAIDQALDKTRVPLYSLDNLKYAPDGRLIGAEFHLDRPASHVYAPGYTQLPEDLPNERTHQAINPDWYFVQSDRN